VVVFVIFVFAFEETKYTGHLIGAVFEEPQVESAELVSNPEAVGNAKKRDEMVEASQTRSQELDHTPKTYRQRMRLVTPTPENLLKVTFRPVEALFCLPGIAYGAVLYGTTLAWVACFISIQSIYMPYPPWNFNTTKIGLLFLAPFIGLALGLLVGGWGGDKMIIYFARRNGGIYEPEMRLYAQFIPAIISTAGLLTFGLTIAEVSECARLLTCDPRLTM
jgi:hypothetical protein